MDQQRDVDLLLYKHDETYIKIETDHKHILQEISDYFTIEVPGAKFMPAYKKGWDGKLRLFNQRTRKIYLGLFSELIEYLKNSPYTFLADASLKNQQEVSDTHIREYIKSLNLPYKIRDYQYNALAITLRNKRATIQSSTGSGKSLIIYLITRYFDDEKVLIIVPTISLTTQLYGDFQDYSKNDDWRVDDYVHVITGGIEKDSPKNIYISTWQSLYALPKEYFQQFRTIIIDETHQAQSNSIKRILENSVNANVRVGLTGTLQETKTHILTIQGLLGDIHRVSDTKDLQKRNILADIKIKMVLLEHTEEERKSAKSLSYQEEVDYLLAHKKRNKFLFNLIGSKKGNTLVLASFVDKQGQVIYDAISRKYKDRPVFFVYGDMPKEEREMIRQFTEKNDGVIIVATYGVFSTGINIKKLHTIIFSMAGKSKIRNLQSIGRGLRTHESKERLELIDIADDLSYNGRSNYSLKHFEHRYKQYLQEKFDVSFYKVPLFKQLPSSTDES